MEAAAKKTKKELADLIRAAEALVAVPVQVLLILLALLPKATGGERTVTLQALWHVLWSATRGAKMRSWDEAVANHWDSAIKGASAQRAGCLRRLLDEISVLAGVENIGAYWGFEKFYGRVDLEFLIGLGHARGFPLAVAAMDLQVHVGVRVLRWAGSHSEPIPVTTSVLAGSKFSNSYARLYLYDILEDIHYKYPVQVGLHVDDIAVQFHGSIDKASWSWRPSAWTLPGASASDRSISAPRARSSAPSRQQPRSLRRSWAEAASKWRRTGASATWA